MRERITRSRDPATAGPGPAIASRVSNTQPPLALAWQTSSRMTYKSNSAAYDVKPRRCGDENRRPRPVGCANGRARTAPLRAPGSAVVLDDLGSLQNSSQAAP